MAHDRKRLTKEDLNAILNSEIQHSQLVSDTKLSNDQADAMDLYMGKPFGTEVDGRSHFVSRDVMDTIEWIMPVLMDIYTSTDEPVVIQPQNQEDVVGARQETAYLSYVMNRQNPGFTIIHNFFKDCLLSKIGVVKHWWDENKTSSEEVYEDLTDEELDYFLEQEDVEIIEHTAVSIETGDETEEIIAGATHTIRLVRTEMESQIRLENIPPEEFKIDRSATSKHNAKMMAHITQKTVSDLIAMGFDQEIIEGLAFEKNNNNETLNKETPTYQARYNNDSTDAREFTSTRTDLAMTELTLEEIWIKVDYDNDGIAELRQIFRIGKEILSNEAMDAYPFNFTSPILIPHKLIGLSITDLVCDIQRIKSHLIRAMLDNINSANNGGFTVLEGAVNIEDMLTSRPLKIVRVKAQNAVSRLDHQDLPPEAFQMIGYLDQIREDRTGVNGVSKGLDESVFGSNTPASAVGQLLSAAQQRVQLIARVLAETGLREIYRDIHRLALEHVKQEQIFQLNGEFISVRPDAWKDRRDFTVTVGTGHVNKDQKMLHLQMFGQDLQTIVAAGGLGTIVQPKNIYNLAKEKLLTAGIKNVGELITDPDTVQTEEEGPSIDEQVKVAELQLKQQETEIAKFEAAIKQEQVAVAKAKAKADIVKIEHEMKIAELEVLLKQEELELEREQGRGVKIG